MKENIKNAHMRAAVAYSELSYCKRKQVGCIIVKDDSVISIGFNGTLTGDPNVCEGEDGTTLPTVIHAEMNALTKLAKSGGGADGSSLFVTCSPCIKCAMHIIQSGITSVYYSERYGTDDGLMLLEKHNIKTEYIVI